MKSAMTHLHPLLLATALATAMACGAAHAQTAPTLTPAPERISDAAIKPDQQTYLAMQARIKALNDRGLPVRDYFLSKSQCWLDVSFHEYTRNDRSGFPQAAMSEADKLVRGLENKSTLSMDTALVNGAARLRPDLWDRARALKADAGFACAQQKVACAEVELVHAGNEHQQQEWRHAKPYVQIAEDLMADAQALAAACQPPAAPPQKVVEATKPPVAVVAPPPPLPSPPPVVVAKPLQWTAGVLFDFDKHEARHMRKESVAQLDTLLRQINNDKLNLTSIKLAGFADRLNGTGKADYNQRLSEKRVATVKAELLRMGLSAVAISTVAGGDSQPVQGCAERFTRQADLQECLLPNRRVEVRIEATPR
jgi:OmpA-OmpF porin, OOP family